MLYMSGSSNFPPLLAKLAPAISKTLERLGQQPITPVFKTTTSCAGVQSIYPDQTKPSTTPPTYYAAHTIRDLTGPADSYPQYFDTATGKLASCSLGPTGATVDIGESEIFAETCPNMTSNFLEVADTPKVRSWRSCSLRPSRLIRETFLPRRHVRCLAPAAAWIPGLNTSSSTSAARVPRPHS